jgi:threonine dehydratase
MSAGNHPEVGLSRVAVPLGIHVVIIFPAPAVQIKVNDERPRGAGEPPVLGTIEPAAFAVAANESRGRPPLEHCAQPRGRCESKRRRQL